MPDVTADFEITEVATATEIDRFLALPYDLYRGQEAWAPPLRLERKEQLDPNKNPAARDLDRQLFLAVRDGRDVGRIAAFINPLHDKQHDAETAFFGYFDGIDDDAVLKALLDRVQEWVTKKGRVRMVGPVQWSTNEEVGVLVDGFEHRNVMLMPYGRPYYAPAIESAGFEKAVDLLAFQSDLYAGYPRTKLIQAMLAYAERSSALTWRRLDAKNFHDEIEVAMDIFNDAWSENWGFVPFSDSEIQHLAKEMKPLISPDLFLIGEVDGESAGFVCVLPDLNELSRGFDGKLLPFNWAKLVYRLKRERQNRPGCR